VAQREFPSCPPQLKDDRDEQYGESLLKTAGGGKLLHHAAPFACTRWTNLYFDRDTIGGSIDDLGTWIRNKRLDGRGLFPHTRYWRAGADHTTLLQALDLRGWWTEENRSAALETQDRDSVLLRGKQVLTSGG